MASLALGSCRETGPTASVAPSADVSSRYSHIRVVSEDGRSRRVLVPEACLGTDADSPADQEARRLPPGCANAYNLQRMAERKSDLTQGRELSDAPAAPAARAAQQYIDGRREPVLGGGIKPDREDGDGAESVKAQ